MFTNIARSVSFITVAIGVIAMIASFFVAPDIFADEFDRGAMEQATLWMTQGSMMVFFGLALGVLSEISEKLER